MNGRCRWEAKISASSRAPAYELSTITSARCRRGGYAESQKPGGKALASTHSPFYYPVPEPTLRTGVLTMSMAILELLGEKRAP